MGEHIPFKKVITLMTKLVSVLLIAFIISSILHAGAALAAQPMEVKVLETDIYQSGTRIKNLKLFQGCVVMPLGSAGVRTKVKLRNGISGTMYASNLKASSRTWAPLPAYAAAGISASNPQYARIASDVSLLRTAPNSELHPLKDKTRIGYAPRGIVFPVIGRSGHWLKVRLGKTLSGWLIDETIEFVPASQYGAAQLLNTGQGAGESCPEYSYTFTRPVFFRTVEDERMGKLNIAFYNTTNPGDERGILKYSLPLTPSYKGVHCEMQGNTVVIQIRNFAIDPENPLKDLVIVLDPGHGSGYDNPQRPDWGAVHSGYYESDMNLTICTKLYHFLTAKGANVYLTRVDKQVNDMFLYDRLERARKVNTDIFLSIHHNSGTSQSLHGMEYYWSTPSGRPLAGAIFKSCTDLGFAYNDKGIYYASFAVTRVSEFPSVLLEMGFMSNPGELGRLLSAEYQDTLVKAIADGVEAFARKKATAAGSTK